MKKKLTLVAFIFTSLFLIASISVSVSYFKKGDFSGGIISILLVVGISFLDHKLWKSIHNKTNGRLSNFFGFNRMNFTIFLIILFILGFADGIHRRREENLAQTTRNDKKETDNNQSQTTNNESRTDKKEDVKENIPSQTVKNNELRNNEKEDKKEEKLPTCDGISITSDCVVDGIAYSKYIYHPAKEAVSHVENVQTGTETRTSSPYILCNDGFHWGSMTHRGACSGHNGVADFEHVDTFEIPVYQEQVVEDSPAQEEYYEKEEK